jgi:hypothetical protein
LSPREEKGRQLLAELADFLHEGRYGGEAVEHLEAIVAIVRGEFTTPIDGTGDIEVPLAAFLEIQVTPDGIGFGAKTQ